MSIWYKFVKFVKTTLKNMKTFISKDISKCILQSSLNVGFSNNYLPKVRKCDIDILQIDQQTKPTTVKNANKNIIIKNIKLMTWS